MFLGYIRVSSLEQASPEKVSLAQQEQVIRGVAMAKGIGQFDLAMYSDPGVSGSVPLRERPSGRKLIREAVKGDTICAAKLDRMFRSAVDALESAEMLKKRGVDLILFDLGVEPVTNNGMAKCFFTMAAAFAELERERINERTRDGRAGKRRSGGHLGGAPPFGYRVVGKGKSATLEHETDELRVRNKILNLVREHGSYGKAMPTILERGYRTRRGKPFTFIQVRRIVERAAATGEMPA